MNTSSEGESAEDPFLSSQIKRYGEELGNLMYHLQIQWIEGKSTWLQYKTLFGGATERINLLNCTGGRFFASVQDSFFQTSVLALCRLTDPIKLGKNENMVVRRLAEIEKCIPIVSELEACFAEIDIAVRSIRTLRSKTIAHADYTSLVERKARQVSAVPLAEIDGAFATVYKPLQTVALELADIELVDTIISSGSGARSVLCRLFDSKVLREEQKKVGPENFLEANLNYPEWLSASDIQE